MSDFIISLTTIPPRMAKLGPTLESLRKQTVSPAAIILWLPKKYRRDSFNPYQPPEVPPGVEIRYCDVDYGPATKILPAVRAFEGQDVTLIYCDDDRIYEPDWAELLLNGSKQFPRECISTAGMSVKRIEYRYFRRSRSFHLCNALTFGYYARRYARRSKWIKSKAGPVDICEGFGGVLVRPEFFPDSVFDIPDLLWTVDDVWIAGQLAINGIRGRRVSDTKKSLPSEAHYIQPLATLVHNGSDRADADMRCVNYFRKKYGIWK